MIFMGVDVRPAADFQFLKWLAGPPNVSTFTNDAGYLISETDPVFNAWLIATPPLYSEIDPIYSANSYATGMDQGVATTDTPTFSQIALSSSAYGYPAIILPETTEKSIVWGTGDYLYIKPHIGGGYYDLDIYADDTITLYGSIVQVRGLRINDIPTSASGLSTGDVWCDATGGSNILKIVL